MFKKRETYTDWLTPQAVELVKLETSDEHLARVHERFLEQKQKMGAKYLLHPKNRVRRLDGKSYAKDAKEKQTNVRPLRKKERQAA